MVNLLTDLPHGWLDSRIKQGRSLACAPASSIGSSTAPILAVATLELGVVIVIEALLSFLGLGAGASQPTWDSMLADGRAYVTQAWWLATLPGVAAFVVVPAVNVLGDALRDALDPRHESLRRLETPV